ncbi:tape measure protein [Devosia elaeis]|uniref:Tape measure protein N-terminal domain-containing protein n=1 Tax=Devosia elaeis TaxID=1770058 RepID=A0A178I0C2_9HYPH|nr:tape measure protein [Devosia elaeis]OAM77764.1 hypothetical protein A3840_08440 [Devosia elaeis]
MATDIERLIVSLEASTTKYERALAKANGETDRRVRSMQARYDGLGSRVTQVSNGMASSLGIVTRAFGLLGVAFGTQALIGMTTAWTDLSSRVNNAAGSLEKGTAVMDRLVDVANRTYSSLEQTAEGYLQNQQALSALGYSTAEQLDLTESLNNALVISATRGDKARSVQEAWSKAMASGSLRGDNLNTVIQSGGRLSKALADSMGVSVNELRKLGSEGKITTDKMFGVTSQLAALRAEADAMPATVADAVIKLQTAALRFIGESDTASGGSSKLAESIERLAAAIDNMPRIEIFDWLANEAEAFNRGIEGTKREIEAIGGALEYLQTTRTDEFFQDIWDKITGADSQRAKEAIWAIEDSLRDVAIAAAESVPEVGQKLAELAGDFLHGKKTAEEAKAAILQVGKEAPDVAPTVGRLWTLIDTLSKVYSGAIDAAAAVEAVPVGMGGPVHSRGAAGAAARRIAARKALETDGGDGDKPVVTTSSASRGTSPTERYGESVEEMRRRLQMLQEENFLVAHLGHAPSVTEYVIHERLAA